MAANAGAVVASAAAHEASRAWMRRWGNLGFIFVGDGIGVIWIGNGCEEVLTDGYVGDLLECLAFD